MNWNKTVAGFTLGVFVLTAGAAAALADGTQPGTGTTVGAATGATAGATPGTTAGTPGTTTGATANPSTGATAGASGLPDVTVTPSSVWYSLKLFFEQMRVTLTIDSAKKAELLMEQARERLAEAQKSVAAGNTDAALTAIAEYKKTMGAVTAQAKAAAQANKDLTRLEAQIRTTKPEWARVLAEVVAAAPVAKRQQLAGQLTPVLVEMAQAERIVHKDDAGKDQKGNDDKGKNKQPPAPVVATPAPVVNVDVTVVQKMQAAGVSEQSIADLKAMAQKSGKTLAEVYALYQIEHVTGQLAGSLTVSAPDAAKTPVPQSTVVVQPVKQPSDENDQEQDDDNDQEDQHAQAQQQVKYTVKLSTSSGKGQHGEHSQHGQHGDHGDD